MIESSLAGDSAAARLGRRRDGVGPARGPGRGRRVLQQLDEQRLDPAEHVAEAERHRGRKQQADRPEQEQRQAAGAARDEPAVAQLLPALDAAAPVQRRADGDAERACRAH